MHCWSQNMALTSARLPSGTLLCSAMVGKSPTCLPSKCSRGAHFDTTHVLHCSKGGFTMTWHNEVREILSDSLRDVCSEVNVEPFLFSPVTGEELEFRSASTDSEARLDIAASGFLGCRFEQAFFDVRVFSPFARRHPQRRLYPYKKKSRGIFSSSGPHDELMSPHEELMSPHESSWGLMRILKSSWAVFKRNFAHGFSAIAHEFWEMLMSLDELLVCSWALRDCSCRVMSLPFLTEKSWSRATHLKIRVTAVPMTTCHERGKNMNAVWPGFVANVAGRHFLHRFEFRALAAVLCQFVLCFCKLQVFTLQFVFVLLELSTLTFQDSFMLSRKRSFSVYLRSLD